MSGEVAVYHFKKLFGLPRSSCNNDLKRRSSLCKFLTGQNYHHAKQKNLKSINRNVFTYLIKSIFMQNLT